MAKNVADEKINDGIQVANTRNNQPWDLSWSGRKRDHKGAD